MINTIRKVLLIEIWDHTFIQRYNCDILTKSVRIEVIRMVIIGDLNNGGNNCHASSKYITDLCFCPLDANVMHSCIQKIHCLYYWKLDFLSLCTHILSSVSLFANWTNGARSTRGTRSSGSANRASVTTLTLEKNKQNTLCVSAGWKSIGVWTSHHFCPKF